MTTMVNEKVGQTLSVLEKLWQMQVDKEPVIEISQSIMQPPNSTTTDDREGAKAGTDLGISKNAIGLQRIQSNETFKINEEEYN
jgi:hypothetical protein